MSPSSPSASVGGRVETNLLDPNQRCSSTGNTALTQSVVANHVLLSVNGGVGPLGSPLKVGVTMGA